MVQRERTSVGCGNIPLGRERMTPRDAAVVHISGLPVVPVGFERGGAVRRPPNSARLVPIRNELLKRD